MRSRFLSGAALFQSTDAGQVEQELVRTYGIRHFDLLADVTAFRANAGFVQLPRIGLSYCNYLTPVRIDFPEADYVRQQFVLTGKGLVTVGRGAHEIDGARSFVTAADAPVRFDYGGGFQQLVVTLKSDAIRRHMRHLIGSIPKVRPNFQGNVDVANPEQQRLLRLVRFVAQELALEHAPLPKNLMLEYEDALVTAFISASAGDLSELLEIQAKSISPWQVRATEEYIEANWRNPITIEVLAENIGASARSIFQSFKNARGYSPMSFLKSIRLKHARDLLIDSDLGTSVTSVGYFCGFHNLSHFANSYMLEFGEKPSETLKRARGNRPAALSWHNQTLKEKDEGCTYEALAKAAPT